MSVRREPVDDLAHLHAVTAIGPSGAPTYTASYDAAGNMTCRAPTTATTCAGTPTGATLSYDTQGRLASWTGGTVTDSFLYDGAGNRVAQLVNVNGTNTTTTTYVDGGQEEIATNSSGSTLTKYFPGIGGLPTAERSGTNGALTYLASDGEGSVSAALDSTGNATFQQLYTPYGSVRYSNGASPTAFGYTGQRADAATGLDYYHARYYDPVAQQFVSADSMQQGLSRYGYVGGNPETATDPTGHRVCEFNHCGGGGGGSGGCMHDCGGPPPCTSNCGSGGTHQVNCATTPAPTITQCQAYVTDYTHDTQERDKYLSSEKQTAARLILGGLLAGGVIDLIELFMKNEGVVAKGLEIYDLIMDLVGAFTWLPAATGSNTLSPAIYRTLQILNGIASALNAGLVLVKGIGQFGLWLLDKGFIVAQGALEGLPGLIKTVLEQIAGNVIFQLLSAGAHAVAAIGYGKWTDVQSQSNMNISDWCAGHPSAGCVPLPSPIVTVPN